MKKALRSYEPRVKPLFFDSLAARTGCERETSNRYFGELPFNMNCIATHDVNSLIFTQPDSVSYAFGPSEPGEEWLPNGQLYTCWVATGGVRIGRVGIYDESTKETAGEASGLYLTSTPSKVSHAFDYRGLLAIAIQDILDIVEVKRYVDTDGTTETVRFPGISPVMFCSGLVSHGEPDAGMLTCYYLKPESPNTLFARFESDGFAAERIVISSMRVRPSRLISVVKFGLTERLYYIDSLARDGTLKSADERIMCDDAVGIEPSIYDGDYRVGAIGGSSTDYPSIISLSISSGVVLRVTVEPEADPSADESLISVGMLSGEIT